MKKLTTAVTAVTFLASMMAAPANAAVTLISSIPDPNPEGLSVANLAAAQLVCDAAAATADADGPAYLSDHYHGYVNEGTVTLKSGPTISGPQTNTSPVTPGAGATFTPAHTEIDGNPYRNGGSVNMFGLQKTVGGYYSTSAYDFTADFTTVYTHPYTCDVTMEDFTAAHTIHHKAVGHYINCDFGHGQGNDNGGTCEDVGQPQASCAAHNAVGDTLPFWGQDTEQCKFIGTAAYDENIPDTWGDETPVGNFPGGSFDQTQHDTLSAHESAGPGYFDGATVFIGQVVVCISPSKSGTKLPGAWEKKNGYTGDKCTTAWYNGTAPYSTSNYAGTNVPNLNDGSHNFVTVPVV